MTNHSRYRHEPESVFEREDRIRGELHDVTVERDSWRKRAERAERRLAAAELELGGEVDINRCLILGCEDAQVRVGRTPLCETHLQVACRDQLQIWDEQVRSEPCKVPADMRKRLTEGTPWVVYYIAMGGRVKIGRSSNLAKRMRTFSATPDQLLAVEPGVVVNGLNRETQRHREFAKWRTPNTELFEMSDELLRHIAEVVATFGEPQRYLAA